VRPAGYCVRYVGLAVWRAIDDEDSFGDFRRHVGSAMRFGTPPTADEARTTREFYRLENRTAVVSKHELALREQQQNAVGTKEIPTFCSSSTHRIRGKVLVNTAR
jgi:hypothetical protein